jgi:hypothetical protein
MLLLCCIASAPLRSQDGDTQEIPPSAEGDKVRTDAGPAAHDVGGQIDPDGEEGQEPEKRVVGRLLITTDAAATIVIDGVSLGELQPGDELAHEVTRDEGEIKAVGVDAAAAQVKRPYAFKKSPEEELGPRPETAELPLITIRIRMAKTIRTLRKTERQEKIYPDFSDGVMWTREDNRANVTWNAARKYCDELDLGAYRDWRLPDLEELSSLQALWSQAAFKTADTIRLSDCCPWSSTEIDEENAWNFNFRFRREFEGRKGHSFGMRALCIRTLTEAEIIEHEEAIAERERKKKEEKKRRKALKKGLIEEESEEERLGEQETEETSKPEDPPT